jgi:pilus assembly protein CpaB
MLLLVVAVALGLGAAYMAAKLLGGQKPEETVQVLVASKEIPQGTLVSDPDQYFKEKTFIRGQEPKNYVSKKEELKDRIVVKALPEDQFCTEQDLLPKDRQITVPTTDGKPPNDKNRMVAVAVRVTPFSFVGGNIGPGNHVDVVYFENLPNGKHQVRTILFDITVLAVDNLSQLPEGAQGHNANTVTLAVTPAEAERLALATDKGQLRFSLLRKDDYGKEKAAERKKIPPIDDQGDVPSMTDLDRTVEVLVAKKDIPAQTPLDEALFTTRNYLESEKPQRAISDLSKYRGKILKHALAANKFLTEGDLDSAALDKGQKRDLPSGSVVVIQNGPGVSKVLYPDGPDSIGVPLSPTGEPLAPFTGVTRGRRLGWKTHTSDKGRFSILMPGKVDSKSLPLMGSKDGVVEIATDADGGFFSVAHGTVPVDPESDPQKYVTELAQRLIAQAPDSKVVGKLAPISMGNSPGVEFKLQRGSGVTDCRRVYLVKDHLYVVNAVGKNLDPKSPEISEYFRSFSVDDGQ